MVKDDKVTRVVLVDDHAVVRVGMTAVLSAAPDIDVVGEADDGRQAVELARQLRPDVIVMDLSMPGMDGVAGTRAVVNLECAPRVLVVTMHDEMDYLRPLIEAGAAGYLVKSAADRELVQAVRTVARGEMYIDPKATSVLVNALTREDPLQTDRQRLERLTTRERDVLRLVAQGYSAAEVGERLFISAKTVDTYKQRVQEKLGFGHRAEYVQFALRMGLLNDI